MKKENQSKLLDKKSILIIILVGIVVLLSVMGVYLLFKNREKLPWIPGKITPDKTSNILEVSVPQVEMIDSQGNPTMIDAWLDTGVEMKSSEYAVVHSKIANRCYIVDNKGNLNEVYAPTNLVDLKTSYDKFAFAGKDRTVGIFSNKAETLYYDFHPGDLTSIVFQDEDTLLVGGVGKESKGIIYKISISKSEIVENIPLNEVPNKLHKLNSKGEIYYASDSGIYRLDGAKKWSMEGIYDFVFTEKESILAITRGDKNTVRLNRNDGVSVEIKGNYLGLYIHPEVELYSILTYFEKDSDHIVQVTVLDGKAKMKKVWEKGFVNNIIRSETFTLLLDGSILISYRGDKDPDTANYYWNIDAYTSTGDNAFEKVGTYTVKSPIFSVFSWGDQVGIGLKGKLLKLPLNAFK